MSITDDQADVVVNKSSLSDTERAQIEDIIKRKSGVSVENITISSVTLTAQTSSEAADEQTTQAADESETYSDTQPVS